MPALSVLLTGATGYVGGLLLLPQTALFDPRGLLGLLYWGKLAGSVRTSSGEPEPVLREPAVAKVEQLRDAGQACRRDKKPEPYRGVEPTKHLDPLDQRAVGQPAMDAVHEGLHRHADRTGVKRLIRDVDETDALPPVEPAKHPDLVHAERTVAVVERLDVEGGHVCPCGLTPPAHGGCGAGRVPS